MESSISLLSHSDTSRSTIDSLEQSEDGTELDDEITLTNFTEGDSLENVIVDNHPANGPTDNSADSLENNNPELDSKTQTKDEENNNNNINVDKSKAEQSKGNTLIPTVARSKIPKSKTFDETSSVFNNKYSKVKFQGELPLGREQGSRNHVFMTSQECMVVPGCSKLPRATIASRLRFEKQHSADNKSHSQGNMLGYPGDGFHKQCTVQEGYQTPSQRKDLLIRDMKRQVREIKQTCDDKDQEIAMYKQHLDEKTSKLVQGKDEEIERLREELRHVKQSYDDISAFCEESIAAASMLEQKAEELKSAMTDREKQHQKIYLEMYRKGQDSARFEREEELERLATSGGCKVTISELVKRLAWTELELAKWQTLRRDETYQDALRPETEADVTIRFLKDSFFHYITDEKDSDHHLRALIKIFKYTEPQMVKIRESKIIERIEKKNKKKSKK